MSTASETPRARTSGRTLRTGATLALGLGLLTGTAGAVQAGFLDSLFGSQPGPVYATQQPSYHDYGYDHYTSPYAQPQQRRRSVQTKKPRKEFFSAKETPPAKVEAICCKNGEDPMKALLLDTTLVAGDVVMTPEGMRTFVGTKAPHRASDLSMSRIPG